jgi:hypothetical protein
MKSGEAFGWVLTGLINEHVRVYGDPGSETVEFNPDDCGPCAALKEYFLTPRGRDEVDIFVRQVPRPSGPWQWQNGDGTVNWVEIERRLVLPRHEERGEGERGPVPMVTIKKKVYDELISDQKFFIALQNAGVDNWEGWEHVLHAVNEED